jgi:cysteine desulfurase
MIYLDNNSTTCVDPLVVDEMLRYFSEDYGNAASRTHAFGWKAAEAIDVARNKVADFLDCSAGEVIFTSGATESVNLAIKGVAEAYYSKGNHIVTVMTEHKAVLDTCRHLEKQGKEVTYLPVLQDGMLDLKLLEEAIRPDTILVCVMLANNETGVIHPLADIARIVHDKKSLLFTDATQAAGKIRVSVKELEVDLLCISAHKMYGPKGVGALFVRRRDPRVTLIAQIDGGGHERGLRSGTLNVPGIAGLGKACELAADRMWDDAQRISIQRTKLEQSLTENDRGSVNGNIRHRLPNTSNICFHKMKADKLIHMHPAIAMATGSACSSALPEPSHVLIAMGLNEQQAYSSVRFSLGRFTTDEEINRAIEIMLHDANDVSRGLDW